MFVQAKEVHTEGVQAVLVHVSRPATATVQVTGGLQRRLSPHHGHQSARLRGHSRRQSQSSQVRHQARGPQLRRHD